LLLDVSEGRETQLRVGAECTFGLEVVPLIRHQQWTMDNKSMLIRLFSLRCWPVTSWEESFGGCKDSTHDSEP
jgi:hypothetical protein